MKNPYFVDQTQLAEDNYRVVKHAVTGQFVANFYASELHPDPSAQKMAEAFCRVMNETEQDK